MPTTNVHGPTAICRSLDPLRRVLSAISKNKGLTADGWGLIACKRVQLLCKLL
jgi:hypothetical protein